MGGAGPVSPEIYETRDVNGSVQCHFEIDFNQPSPWPLTQIVAYNALTSPYTQIAVTDNTGTVHNYPLPTSGKHVSLSTTDGTGTATTVTCYTATVTQTEINSQGFTNLGDIASYTVS